MQCNLKEVKEIAIHNFDYLFKLMCAEYLLCVRPCAGYAKCMGVYKHGLSLSLTIEHLGKYLKKNYYANCEACCKKVWASLPWILREGKDHFM